MKRAAIHIIIADDEFLVRSSLRSMLDELDLPLDFIGEAANGGELVNLIRQTPPEVAFVDIRMPGLNGLEAIRRARELSPRTRWFILTGFSDFEYAQEAIRLGVSGYLLKPVDPEELRKVLSDLIRQNQKQVADQNKYFERELAALWYGLTLKELEEGDEFLTQSHFVGGLICLDSYLTEKALAERHRAITMEIRKQINACLEAHIRLALFLLPNGDLATVGAWEMAPENPAGRRIWEYFQAVDQTCRAASGPDLAATLLISKETSLDGLQTQIEQLQKLAPLRTIAGVGRRLEASILFDQVEKPGRLELGRASVALSRAFHERNPLNYAKSLKQFEKGQLNAHLSADSSLARSLADYFHRSMGCTLPSDPGDERYLQVLKGYGERMLQNIPREEFQNTDLANQVMAFVDQNYMHEITIGQVAEQLNLTPNYLSSLFHKKTGTTFLNYLKTIRLAKAKELLTDPKLRIQQVAEQVGYFSARHFARVFAEQFGCLPSEFREQHKSSPNPETRKKKDI